MKIRFFKRDWWVNIVNCHRKEKKINVVVRGCRYVVSRTIHYAVSVSFLSLYMYQVPVKGNTAVWLIER